MTTIPIEIIQEICSRLPPKSIARCRCVSKQWASMLHRGNFKARPRLLFAVEKSGVWSVFSSLQPQNEKSSSSSASVDLHLKFPGGGDMQMCCPNCRKFSFGYTSGLMYFSGMYLTKTSQDAIPVMCNPNTGRYVCLPELIRYRKSYSFFGFDPIGKEYKVVFIAYPGCSDDDRILTLGSGEMSWRKIQCPLKHYPLNNSLLVYWICINGVVYYLGEPDDEFTGKVLVCFDVRSESFRFVKVKVECFDQLINYEGKLGGISFKNDDAGGVELSMWVLEDVENSEWSNYVYTLPDEGKVIKVGDVTVVGMTATTGEFVLSTRYQTCEERFYVFYFNPEGNTLRSVEIQGFGTNHDGECKCARLVYTFIDHEEDLEANNANLLKSSV